MSDDSSVNKESWAIGGGVLIGIGVGFFFLQQSVFYFIGSIMVGLGLGLVASAVLSKIK